MKPQIQSRPNVPWRFTVLTLAISWGLWLVVAASGRDPFTDLEAGVLLVLGGFGPAVAALLEVWRTAGEAGWRAYWRRIFSPSLLHLPWVALVLALYPLTIAVSALLTGSALDASPLAAMLGNPAGLLVTLGFVVVFGPLSEEIGWRGFGLDQLLARWNALTASLIMGLIWWIWHLPLLAVPGSFLHSTGGDPFFLFGYLVTVCAYSVLFTWARQHNQGSILIAILFHYSINLTNRLIALPVEVFVVESFVLVAVAAAVVLAYGPRHLNRGPGRRAHRGQLHPDPSAESG
jgi:uncharacterized protein